MHFRKVYDLVVFQKFPYYPFLVGLESFSLWIVFGSFVHDVEVYYFYSLGIVGYFDMVIESSFLICSDSYSYFLNYHEFYSYDCDYMVCN